MAGGSLISIELTPLGEMLKPTPFGPLTTSSENKLSSMIAGFSSSRLWMRATMWMRAKYRISRSRPVHPLALLSSGRLQLRPGASSLLNAASLASHSRMVTGSQVLTNSSPLSSFCCCASFLPSVELCNFIYEMRDYILSSSQHYSYNANHRFSFFIKFHLTLPAD